MEGREEDFDAPHPLAATAADGSFELTTFKSGDGAPEGSYYVFLYWPENASSQGKGKKNLRKDLGKDILKGRYSDHAHIKLRAQVEAKANQLPPFEIQD
jgi:hypothetical protein